MNILDKDNAAVLNELRKTDKDVRFVNNVAVAYQYYVNVFNSDNGKNETEKKIALVNFLNELNEIVIIERDEIRNLVYKFNNMDNHKLGVNTDIPTSASFEDTLGQTLYFTDVEKEMINNDFMRYRALLLKLDNSSILSID